MLINSSPVACIASVSVGLGSKERPRNETGTVFCSREIGARAKIRKRGGEAEKRKRLRTNPWIIGSRRATEPCLQKFLAEQGFSRELPQHGGNPVVQCRRFGISKRDSAILFSLFSFSGVLRLACLNSKDFLLFVFSQAIIHATISSLWRVSQTLFYWSWLCSS